MHTDLTTLCVNGTATVREAIAQIDRSRLGIVLVTNESRRLLGTVTDGDVRRAILANTDLSQPVTMMLARKASTKYARPITGFLSASREAWLHEMKAHDVLHLPLLDEAHRVVRSEERRVGKEGRSRGAP